jgi:hypothetical protein
MFKGMLIETAIGGGDKAVLFGAVNARLFNIKMELFLIFLAIRQDPNQTG